MNGPDEWMDKKMPEAKRKGKKPTHKKAKPTLGVWEIFALITEGKKNAFFAFDPNSVI